MLIQLTDVYKIYAEGLESEVRALDGVSLTIDRGEFVAITGASGTPADPDGRPALVVQRQGVHQCRDHAHVGQIQHIVRIDGNHGDIAILQFSRQTVISRLTHEDVFIQGVALKDLQFILKMPGQSPLDPDTFIGIESYRKADH